MRSRRSLTLQCGRMRCTGALLTLNTVDMATITVGKYKDTEALIEKSWYEDGERSWGWNRGMQSP